MKYIDSFKKNFKNRPVFSLRDVRIFFKSKKISNEYLYLFIHNLLKKGELKRIARGFYSFSDDSEVVGFAFSPFYYGLQNALSFHGLWQQQTNPVIITSKKVRTGLREIMGTNVVVRRIDKKMFFGFEMLQGSDYFLPVSSIEKTFIDFVYFREKISNEALSEIEKKADKKIIEQYLKKSPLWLKKRCNSLI